MILVKKPLLRTRISSTRKRYISDSTASMLSMSLSFGSTCGCAEPFLIPSSLRLHCIYDSPLFLGMFALGHVCVFFDCFSALVSVRQFIKHSEGWAVICSFNSLSPHDVISLWRVCQTTFIMMFRGGAFHEARSGMDGRKRGTDCSTVESLFFFHVLGSGFSLLFFSLMFDL